MQARQFVAELKIKKDEKMLFKDGLSILIYIILHHVGCGWCLLELCNLGALCGHIEKLNRCSGPCLS